MEGDMFGPADLPVEEVVDVVQEPVAPEPVVEPSEPAAVEPTPQAAPEVVEPKAEPVMVPLAALHEVRDEVKRLKAEAEQRAQQQQAPAPEPIDPWTDLEGALAQRDQQYQQMLFQQKAQMSRRFAEMQHGKEEVEAAIQWAYALCDSDKAFNHKVFTSDDPVGFAVEQYRKEQIASSMSMDDFKAFQAWKAAQSNPQPIAAPVMAQPAPSQDAPPPPRSLATATSAGTPSLPKNDPNEDRLRSMFGA